MKEQFKQSVKFITPIGTLGGFVADVVTPLGPAIKWLFLIFLCSTVILLVINFLSRIKSSKNYLPASTILMLIFGGFFIINNNTEKGVLGDNITAISNLQNSLFNIQETVERVEDKVDIINDKLDLEFDEIKTLIKLNNPIANPTTAKDYIVNAYLQKSSGLLKDSQFSFEEYFRLSKDFSIDILLDYCEIFESNNGYSALKTQLDLLPKTETTDLIKILKKSTDDLDLYFELISDENKLNKNLAKWAVLTLPPSMANGFKDYSSNPSMFMWIYNSMIYHLELGYNCEGVSQFFFNKSKARDLINTNSFAKNPGYFFYVDYKAIGRNTNPWYYKDASYNDKVKQLDSLYLVHKKEGWFR